MAIRSEHSLTLPARGSEEIDPPAEYEPLEATTDHNHSAIEAITSDNEYGATLDRVQTMVGNDDYAVEDEDGNLHPPSYDDIAVLTRTRRFGRGLQSRADEFGIPVAYEGGVELSDTRVHEFAEQYAAGEAVKPSNADEQAVKQFLDGLPGEFRPEENAYLPVSVGDDRVTISGIIDLLHVTDEQVDIVDYKTDRSRHAESEYRKQLSVYYHIIREVYPDRDITVNILYTETGTRHNIDPLPLNRIRTLVREAESPSGKTPADDLN